MQTMSFIQQNITAVPYRITNYLISKQSGQSDFLDIVTRDRLVDGLPDNARAQTKIKKAVCALADKLYGLELAEKQALSAAAGSITSGTGGATTGVITSKSSGSESISYASPSEIANGAKAWSTVYSAAGDEQATNKLLYDTAKGVSDGSKR